MDASIAATFKPYRVLAYIRCLASGQPVGLFYLNSGHYLPLRSLLDAEMNKLVDSSLDLKRVSYARLTTITKVYTVIH